MFINHEQFPFKQNRICLILIAVYRENSWRLGTPKTPVSTPNRVLQAPRSGFRALLGNISADNTGTTSIIAQQKMQGCGPSDNSLKMDQKSSPTNLAGAIFRYSMIITIIHLLFFLLQEPTRLAKK